MNGRSANSWMRFNVRLDSTVEWASRGFRTLIK